MTHLKSVFLTLSAALLILFGACKKEATPIEAPGFGTLTLKGSSLAPEESKFLLQVDGVTLDTLKSASGTGINKKFNLHTGKRRITIISKTNNTLIDTAIHIELRANRELPTFLINGDHLLFDDYNPEVLKPAPGNVLIRFITTDASLPDKMDLKLTLFYGDEMGNVVMKPLDMEVKGVTKTGFSNYIEIVDPQTTAPGNQYSFFFIEGWDAITHTKVLNLIGDGSPEDNAGYVTFDYDASVTFVPNVVISLAIGNSGTLGYYHTGSVLFLKQL